MKHTVRRQRATILAILLAFVALAVLCKLPVWLDPLHTYGGSQDAQQAMWFLSWPPFAVTHHANPLLSSYLNYPDGFNLLWNTSMPALAVLLWPVTALWGAVATYNVITTAAIALSACFGFLAIRRYVHNDIAAAVGGLLYGFSPAMIAQQLGHAQVVFSAVTIPLALLLLDELLVRQRLPAWVLGILIAALAVFQFFVFQEFLVTELIAGAILTLVLGVMYHDRIAERLPYVRRVLVVAIGLGGVALTYPVVAIQLTGPDRIHGAIHSADIYSTSPLNLVIPEGSEWASPSWLSTLSSRFSGNASEADGYVGIPLLAVAAVVFVKYWRAPLVRAAGITSIVITIFSFGPHLTPLRRSLLPLPWYPFSRLPLLSNVLPSRMMYFVFLGLAILLAFALSRLWSRRRNVLLPAALAAVALLPLFPKVPLFWQQLAATPYFSTAAVAEIPQGRVAYTMPFAGTFSMAPMNWQRESSMRFRLIGGYILGPAAPGQEALRQVSSAFASAAHAPISIGERRLFVDELRANGVGLVIVGPLADQAGAVAFCTSVLGSQPQVRDGFDVWILDGAGPA